MSKLAKIIIHGMILTVSFCGVAAAGPIVGAIGALGGLFGLSAAGVGAQLALTAITIGLQIPAGDNIYIAPARDES